MSDEKSNVTELAFDIAPVQLSCRISGEGYVLESASADAAGEWLKGLLKSAAMGEGGSVKKIGEGAAELDFLLLSKCLRHAELNPDNSVKELGDYLTGEEVRKLPNAAVGPMADKVKSISAMNPTLSHKKLLEQKAEIDKKLAEAAGPDPLDGSPKSTTDGSD